MVEQIPVSQLAQALNPCDSCNMITKWLPAFSGLRLFGTLALIAMVMRSFVADGYMVSATPNAGSPFAITICMGSGAQDSPHLIMDGRTGEIIELNEKGEPVNPDEITSTCPFSIANFAPLSDFTPTVQPVRHEQLVLTIQPPQLSPGRGLAAPPLPARGPPTHI